MKSISEVTALVIDYGTFISIAEKLSQTCRRVYYYSPAEREYLDARESCLGTGIPNVYRLDNFLDPAVLKTIDLAVFTDIGFTGLQRHLKSLGIAVWGHMGLGDLELSRTKFLDVIGDLGLAMVPYKKIVGLSRLADFLLTAKGKWWVKVDFWRENMETWQHVTWAKSERKLEDLAMEWGPLKEHIVFVVQQHIDCDVEYGYDGWTVNGQWPEESYQGPEKKNELYLGAATKYKALPKELHDINDAISPLLEAGEYCGALATEVRIKDKVPYFTDPTFRWPGQTGEQLLETCSNLADVIWHAANGQLLKPKFIWPFAAEATIHHNAGCGWRTMEIPKEVRQWFKGYHYCIRDGAYHFPPGKNDEVGVMVGVGKSVEDAIKDVSEKVDKLSDECVTVRLEGFADLLQEVKDASKEGVEFTDEPVPEPTETIKLIEA